ncbi:MAG TPA: helix-turn-helix domain-containing protein [candidate division Zixibacteria bacterium]|nr:helix-turn-helix domain-containing protein [candidate division Zixibacteria bacterium]
MEASTSAVGSIPYTAGLLGISRTGLYRRMRRYGPVAFAGEATTPPIVAELDTYIYVDNPNTSYGSATELYHGVDTELGTDWRRSCFRFNRDGYVPAGATIKAITLRLRFTFVQYLPAGGSRSSNFRVMTGTKTRRRTISTWAERVPGRMGFISGQTS